WPYEWSGELLLSRGDLGSVLRMLTGGPGPDDGRWNLWLRGTGHEGSSEGSGTIWIEADQGRQMPILGEVFPPRHGAPSSVRGELVLGVRKGAVQILKIALESGAERAIGYGEILPGGWVEVDLLWTQGNGRPSAHRIRIDGKAGSLRVEVLRPVWRAAGGP
ncbi:MAG: hypothetical protein O6952_00185, partial [Planctomycetota bacterium]|nr:hypothetical protein [Planctomycetota bacterium]